MPSYKVPKTHLNKDKHKNKLNRLNEWALLLSQPECRASSCEYTDLKNIFPMKTVSGKVRFVAKPNYNKCKSYLFAMLCNLEQQVCCVLY